MRKFLDKIPWMILLITITVSMVIGATVHSTYIMEHVIPKTNLLYSLGNPSYVWLQIYANEWFKDGINGLTWGQVDQAVSEYKTATEIAAIIEAYNYGDMLKATYDTDDDGKVDKAESLDDGVNSVTAEQVKQAVDLYRTQAEIGSQVEAYNYFDKDTDTLDDILASVATGDMIYRTPDGTWGILARGTENQIIAVNAAESLYWVDMPTGGAGTTTFKGLSDTPSSYSGQAGKYPRVNVGETGLDFEVPAGAGDMARAVYDTDSNDIVDNSEDTQAIKGKLVDAPVEADDGKVLEYDHANSKFKLGEKGGGGVTPISFEMRWEEGDQYHQHFNIRIGVGTSPEGGSYDVDKESKDNQTDWVYYSPDNLVPIPAGGVDYLHDGLRAQHTITTILTVNTIYNCWKRVYNVDDSVYGDWDFMGAICR